MTEGQTVTCAWCHVEQAWPTAFPIPRIAKCHACSAEPDPQMPEPKRFRVRRIWPRRRAPRGRRIDGF